MVCDICNDFECRNEDCLYKDDPMKIKFNTLKHTYQLISSLGCVIFESYILSHVINRKSEIIRGTA